MRSIAIARLDERVMGALLMHFMLETIIMGLMMGIDPFDQPAVEQSKVLTREYLETM
jgi:glucose-6-phosphate isomerase